MEKQVVLVTGASSGMGRDFALRLLAEGYVVYGAARRAGRMQEIRDAGGFVLSMDVTDEASMAAGVDDIIRRHGRIDVLINSAGYGQYGALEDVPLDEARRQMEINLFGLARLTQICLPHMRSRKFGKIFNISSIAGRFAAPLGGWYHASKFALEAYSDTLRLETAPFGIDVVVIQPGGIQSEWADIAAEEAQRLSGRGVYAGLVAKLFKLQASQSKGSAPRVISDLIVKALKARKPKTRYHAGFMASPVLFLRSLLSDRMFDRMLMLALK